MLAVAALIAIPGFAEPFSSLSHLVGAGVFLALAAGLVWRGRGDALRTTSLAVFGAGSVLLLAVSGVYHLLPPGGANRLMLQRLDHAAIFFLIAASFTPTHVILFRGWGRWGMLALVWGLAIAAITIKTVYFASLPTWAGLTAYLALGWLGLGTGLALWRRYGFRFMELILWGGVAYSIGAVLEFINWPVVVPGVVQWHEMFHVAVLIGLACHWSFAYTIADGRQAPMVVGTAACPAPTAGG